MYPLIALFMVGVGVLMFRFIVYGNDWVSNKANRHIYSGGSIVSAGTIYDRNGVYLAKSEGNKRIFNSSETVRKATLHTVGDTSGFIPTGIHTVYSEKLSGYNIIDGVFQLKEYGKGSDLYLTLDAQACKVAYNALGSYNGTVGVYNYKTGEVLCIVSKPTYDVNNVPSDLLTNTDKYNGVFINRFFSGVYVPGSTFKVITAACAIENISDIYSQTFECKGKVSLNGGTVICNDVHGKVTFQQALNCSCNCAFAEIAAQLGADKLTATAEALGFNQSLKSGKVNLATSRLNILGTEDYALGWAGIGQYTTLANPCQMMMVMGAIANGGVAVEPQVLSKTVTPFGITTSIMLTKNSTIKMSAETARQLKILLRSNVTDKYGDSNFDGLEMCGKTGTAEVDGEKSHSWFVGFSQRADLPLAVVVVAENAGSGSGVALKAANKVLQQLEKNN